jgi:hypothetical protein
MGNTDTLNGSLSDGRLILELNMNVFPWEAEKNSIVREYIKRTHRPAFERDTRGMCERGPTGKGYLTLITWNTGGKVVQIDHGHNLVVYTGRSALAHLLGDADVTRKVDKIIFGSTSNTPQISDTVIADPIEMTPGVDYKTVTASYPDPPPGLDLKVQFDAVVGLLEGNGLGTQVYREAGLFCANNDMFSHKITGDITKDNTVVLTATWTIIF